MLNLAATVGHDTDADVTTAAAPTTVPLGGFALLSSTVANHGIAASSLTFTDSVPAGLNVVSAIAAGGQCTAAAQTVKCTFSDVAPGRSAPVSVVVAPTASGTYTNSVGVGLVPGATDTNPANNTASASFVVSAPHTVAPTPICTVPNLTRVPSSTAKRVLTLLGCKVGKTSRKHSSSVAKALVVKTSPRAGTYPTNTTVRLTVSSGKAKKHKK
jgi:hypothetical protein